MSLHEPSLEEMVYALMENADQLADPYSAAIVGIKASLSYGLEHDGTMNNHEHSILLAMRGLLFILDPQSDPNYRPEDPDNPPPKPFNPSDYIGHTVGFTVDTPNQEEE